jgi:hypothetical protein
VNGLAIAALLLALWGRQQRRSYRPSRDPAEYRSDFKLTPVRRR